jgi:hypothetical protein
MDKKTSPTPNRQPQNDDKHKNPDAENVQKAHKEADKDIASDAELSAHSPNDDLDEGESARLGEDENGLV